MESRDFEYDEPRGKCADCGNDLDLASERCCAVGEVLELCSVCARRRGGIFDAEEERWTCLPDVADLLESEPPGRIL